MYAYVLKQQETESAVVEVTSMAGCTNNRRLDIEKQTLISAVRTDFVSEVMANYHTYRNRPKWWLQRAGR